MFQSTVHVAHVAESWHPGSVAGGHLPSNCDGEDTVLCSSLDDAVPTSRRRRIDLRCRCFCSAADRAKLDAFLRRCKRSGYCQLSVPTMAELFTDADDAYFYVYFQTKPRLVDIFT